MHQSSAKPECQQAHTLPGGTDKSEKGRQARETVLKFRQLDLHIRHESTSLQEHALGLLQVQLLAARPPRRTKTHPVLHPALSGGSQAHPQTHPIAGAAQRRAEVVSEAPRRAEVVSEAQRRVEVVSEAPDGVLEANSVRALAVPHMAALILRAVFVGPEPLPLAHVAAKRLRDVLHLRQLRADPAGRGAVVGVGGQAGERAGLDHGLRLRPLRAPHLPAPAPPLSPLQIAAGFPRQVPALQPRPPPGVREAGPAELEERGHHALLPLEPEPARDQRQLPLLVLLPQ